MAQRRNPAGRLITVAEAQSAACRAMAHELRRAAERYAKRSPIEHDLRISLAEDLDRIATTLGEAAAAADADTLGCGLRWAFRIGAMFALPAVGLAGDFASIGSYFHEEDAPLVVCATKLVEGVPGALLEIDSITREPNEAHAAAQGQSITSGEMAAGARQRSAYADTARGTGQAFNPRAVASSGGTITPSGDMTAGVNQVGDVNLTGALEDASNDIDVEVRASVGLTATATVSPPAGDLSPRPQTVIAQPATLHLEAVPGIVSNSDAGSHEAEPDEDVIRRQ